MAIISPGIPGLRQERSGVQAAPPPGRRLADSTARGQTNAPPDAGQKRLQARVLHGFPAARLKHPQTVDAPRLQRVLERAGVSLRGEHGRSSGPVLGTGKPRGQRSPRGSGSPLRKRPRRAAASRRRLEPTEPLPAPGRRPKARVASEDPEALATLPRSPLRSYQATSSGLTLPTERSRMESPWPCAPRGRGAAQARSRWPEVPNAGASRDCGSVAAQAARSGCG